MEDLDVRRDSASGSKRRRTRSKRRRRRKRRLAVPAPVMFYATAGLAAMCFALVYVKGERFLGFSIGSCLLILVTLIINDRVGFSKSKRARRSYEARNKFNGLEVAALFSLLMLGIFVSLLAWAT